MIHFLKRAGKFFKRKKNAKKIGVKFTGASRWQLPKTILINDRTIDLDLINDGSTNTSFIEIFLDDVYGLHFFRSYLPEVRAIIDIGANQGLFALAARNIFEAEIHLYEPNPAVMKHLKHHSDIIGATCYNEAVGFLNGYINLEAGKDSLHARTLLSDTGNIAQVSFEKVMSRMNGKADLLKLDCEGAEWEILNDLNSLKKVKAITLEYHLDHNHNHESIKKVLEKGNFEILHYEISGPSWGMAWAINSD